MELIEITDIEQDDIKVYASLTEHELRESNNKEGLLIAESPKVIKVALEEGYEPVSLLCERKHITGDAFEIIHSLPSLKVYTGEREILSKLTGYKLTRGVLCAMKRKSPHNPADICLKSRIIAVIEAVCDTTNIGSIFRSAAALGIDGILLTPDSCDPFNRRSIRVSMGCVFKIPWSFTPEPIEMLKKYGFTTIALTLHKDSVPIDSRELSKNERIGIVLGTEGEGLSKATIEKCDYKAIIPMYNGIDSLNVGSAAAVAFWQFRKHDCGY